VAGRRIKRRGKSARGKKAAATRKANIRRANRARRERQAKNAEELRKIERLLDEDFDNLAQARRALKEEASYVPPSKAEVGSADEYDRFYDEWDDGGVEFFDDGEVDGGADY
jgi:hypothetical protein